MKDKEIEDEMWPNEYAFIQQNFTSGCTQSQHVTQELKRVAKKARKIEREVAVLKDKVVTVQPHGLEMEAQPESLTVRQRQTSISIPLFEHYQHRQDLVNFLEERDRDLSHSGPLSINRSI